MMGVERKPARKRGILIRVAQALSCVIALAVIRIGVVLAELFLGHPAFIPCDARSCSDDLSECGYPEMAVNILKCSSYLNGRTRQELDAKSWQHMRQAYYDIVGSEKSAFNPKSIQTGFSVPIAIKFQEGEGRGVFAAEDIANGTLVWDASKSFMASFPSGDHWKQLLCSVSQETACDMIMWTFVRGSNRTSRASEMATTQLYVLMDEAALYNKGIKGKSSDGYAGKTVNLRCTENDCRTNWLFEADGNISAGDELLVNYGQFDTTFHNGWEQFGLKGYITFADGH